MNVIERPLPADIALPYLQEMANWLHKDFGPLFARLKAVGRYCSIAPDTLEYESLANLQAGSILPEGAEHFANGLRIVEKRSLDGEFFAKLKRVLTEEAESSLVGFDALISKEDFPDTAVIDLDRPPFGIFRDAENSPIAIREFINQFATAWKTVVLVVNNAQRVRTVQDLSDSLFLFAVSAYDGESFAYWQRLT